MDKKYSYKIENINFILTLAIVCLHASLSAFVDPNSISYNIYSFLNVLFDCAVPVFLYLSCYLFFRNFSLKKYKTKIKTRIRSLVIPYFVWNSLLYLYYVAMSSIPVIKTMINAHSFELTPQSAFQGIVLGQACPQLWFLRVVFVFALISPLLYCICKKLNKSVVFSIVVA